VRREDVESGTSLSTFRRNMLPVFSGSKSYSSKLAANPSTTLCRIFMVLSRQDNSEVFNNYNNDNNNNNNKNNNNNTGAGIAH
jgi:hypothetical protein